MKEIIKSGVVRVTPELAKEWLETRNSHNRSISNKTVNQYARDMSDGNWFNNLIPITFDEETGELKDGQHRLSAVVRSGVSIDFQVNFIPSSEARGFDVNRVRSTKDVLTFNNVLDTQLLTTRVISASKYLLSIAEDGHPYKSGDKYNTSPSVTEKFIMENKDLISEFYDMLPTKSLFTAPESAAILSAMANGYSREILSYLIEFIHTGYTSYLKGKGWMTLRDRRLKHVYPFVTTRNGSTRHPSYYIMQFMLHKAELNEDLKTYRDNLIGAVYYNWYSDKEE